MCIRLAKRKRIFYEPFFIHMGRYRVIGMKNEKSLWEDCKILNVFL